MGALAATTPDAASVDLAEAHRRLLADKTLQFDFTQPPPPPQGPPQWLVDLLRALGPVLEVVFWIGLAAIGVLIAVFLARQFLGVRWKGLKRTKPAPTPAPTWRPEAARARLLLAEADRLAEAGRYAEAAHHLLLHSIQDVEDHRPRSIRPALTSRDIARLDTMPTPARAAFTRIAEIVERNLFGGRAVDQDAFAECRRAYEAFAFTESWA